MNLRLQIKDVCYFSRSKIYRSYKGNKIINIPAKAKEREEIVFIYCLPPNATLTVYAGKRKLGLSQQDLENYRGERGRRGGLLPRGLQKVSRIEVIEH